MAFIKDKGLTYERFKTPFFDIEISDAIGKRKIKLPHHILRLVQKIEIVESFQGVGEGSFSNINISIIEGSREPASPDASLGTEGLYKLPDAKGVPGSVTNRPGLITDLRFSGDRGITWISDIEKQGKIDSKIQKNIEGSLTTRTHKNEDPTPKFLFDARNVVTVTIGYLEDPKTHRSFSGYITSVSTSFPEIGHPVTDIVCLPTGALFDQITPQNSIQFATVKTAIEGTNIVEPIGKKAKEIVEEICSYADMDCIISEELDGDNQDSDKPRTWRLGESLQEFLDRLAKKTNCYFEIRRDNKTNKDYIIFMTKKDFEGKVKISDRALLTWKAPGSILKNFRISADFGALIGNTQYSIDQDGEEELKSSDIPSKTPMFNKPGKKDSKEQLVPTSPVETKTNKTINPVDSCTRIVRTYCKDTISSTGKISPGNSKENDSDLSQINAGELADRAIAAEFTTIGYTQLSPGVVEILGVGVRYSGKYRILTTTHTIDTTGYTTRCVAKSFALPTGGVKLDDIPKGDENNQPKKTGVQLYYAESTSQKNLKNNPKDILKKYDNKIGVGK